MPGRRIDSNRMPSARAIRAMRRRYLAPLATRACDCGACGLTFPPTAGRRYHPQCPNTAAARTKAGKRIRNRALLATTPKPRRCELCEDMPHRRVEPRCPVCWKEPEPETIWRDLAGAGCALGGV